MEENKFALHAHDYAITFDTFNSTAHLANEMIITAYDELNGTKFIASMEHKKYPIFTVMYHPEYLVNPGIKAPFLKRTPLFDKTTDEIAFRISVAFNHWARKNDRRWTLGEETWLQYQVDRVPLSLDNFMGGQYLYHKDKSPQ